MEIVNLIKFSSFKIEYEKTSDINNSIEILNKALVDNNIEIVPNVGDSVKLHNITLTVTNIKRTFDYLAHEKGLIETIIIIHEIELG